MSDKRFSSYVFILRAAAAAEPELNSLRIRIIFEAFVRLLPAFSASAGCCSRAAALLEQQSVADEPLCTRIRAERMHGVLARSRARPERRAAERARKNVIIIARHAV